MSQDRPAETIPGLLELRAATHRDAVALIGNDGTGEYQQLSYRELLELSRAVADRIAASARPQPEGAGAPVAWLYGNANALVAFVLYHAIASLGATNVPVNPASSSTEVADVVQRTAAGLLVAPRDGSGEASGLGCPLLPIDSLADLRAFAQHDAAPAARRDVSPDDPSIVLFTSGTTGRSKGVVHSHRTALAAGAGWQEAFGLDDRDVYQSMFPVYAGAGLHFSGLACLLAGATYLVDEPRPTAGSLARIDRHRSTVYAAVPSIYQYWLAEPRSGVDLSSLRLLDFGGSVMHRSTIEALREWLPGVDLVQTYGLTEAGPGGLYLPPEQLDAKLGSIGSVGSGGLRFRVDEKAAPEDARPDGEGTGDGIVGELQVAGPSLMLGYLDDPENTAKVFDGEWMRTGDLVRVDEEGFVYFLDRLKDLIIRGGFNISSIEVEEALLAHPGIRQAAAFGVPHDSLGEVVGIALVPEGPHEPDLAEVRRFASERLARVKVPVWVVVLDELPLSAAGKPLKTALRGHSGLVEWKGLTTIEPERVDLSERTVVITGAARGLGAAYARECAARGARLLLTDIDAAALAAFADDLRSRGAVVHAVSGNVADPVFGDAIVDACARNLGQVSGWVNNAGVEVLQPVDATDWAAVRAMVEVNLLGTIAGTAAAARAMSPGGSIVNVTSGAQFGMRHLAVYGATKGGIASYTFAASLELAERGIRVNAISPLAGTRMSTAGDVYFSALTGNEIRGADALRNPDSCACLVGFLLSDASRSVTGQVIRFDGRTLSIVRRPAIDEETAVTAEKWSAESVAAAFAGPLGPSLAVQTFRSPGLPVDDH